MDVQSIFYIVGIIFMAMMIGLLLAIAYFLTKVQSGINSMRQNIKDRAQNLTSQANGKFAGIAGGLITSFLLSQLKNMFKKKS